MRSPQAYFDSLAGSASGTGSEGGMSYVTRTSWSYTTDLTASGDDSTLSPFNGYEAGALNLYVSVEVDESYDGGLPSYSTQSAETVHLPMALSSSISLCLSALSDLGAALSSLQSCNSTGVASATASAETTYPVLGAFELGVSSSPQQSGCLVTYSVMTTEAGTGVSGGFQWSVWGEGSLDASVPPGSSSIRGLKISTNCSLMVYSATSTVAAITLCEILFFLRSRSASAISPA